MVGTSISEQVKTTLALYDEFLQEIELPDDHSSTPSQTTTISPFTG